MLLSYLTSCSQLESPNILERDKLKSLDILYVVSQLEYGG